MKTTSKESAKKATATKSEKTSNVTAASKSNKHTPAKPAATEVKATHRAPAAKAVGTSNVATPKTPPTSTATLTYEATTQKAEVVAETNQTAPTPSWTKQEWITARAYQLWQNRGWRIGHDVEDWMEAERELQSR